MIWYCPQFNVHFYWVLFVRELKTMVYKIHDFQKEDDQNRDEIMEELGLHVLRIKNEELENVEQVLRKLRNFIESIG